MFYRIVRQHMVDVEQILNILEVDEHTKDVASPINLKLSGGEIEFKDVTFTYDILLPKEEQRTIIDNISFKIPAGKSLGIVGMTGSGKSTIMRLLYRFYEV